MNNIKITAFKSILQTSTPYQITLEKAIKRLVKGASKPLIDEIRNTEDKEKRNDLKKKLPSICFNGQFSKRAKDGLINHSGLMIIDFDGIPDESFYNTIKENKHIVLAFQSPSNGVGGFFGYKALVKIPESDAETHAKYFEAFEKEFNYNHFDTSNKDVSRICFESYDPNPYINFDAELFNPILEDKGFDVIQKVPLLPITNEDKIIDKIMQWRWKKDFVEGERNSFIFDLAGAFCEYGVSKYNAFGYIQNNVVYGKFKESEVQNTVDSAYKRRSFNIKYFEDYATKKSIQLNLKSGKEKVLKRFKIDEETYDKLKEEQEIENFWYLDDKNKIKVNPLKYKLFLESEGFKKYFPSDTQKPTWVFIDENKVSEISTEKIKDFVLNYLAEKKEFEVWNYCANYQNLFSENFLLMLDSIELKMIQDTKQKSFIAYENGILEVTKDKIKLVDYLDVDAFIWKSQIINREFSLCEAYDNEYQKFISNISNDSPDAIECVLGYLISRYKNKMNNKAIILNDEVISDNPEGGTGKGLFVQGLRQIRKVSILDGKTFDDKKSFPYQTVSQDTDILVFDDVKKNWDFESKFSLVTEGMTLERKNKDAIKLTVEESPKMVVSTNYAIKGEGNSHDRRRHEIEIAQHYGASFTPYDEFKKQLFDDWDLEAFNKFDNYMMRCLQRYLQNGLIKQNAKNIKMRKFIAETAMEFNEWVSDTDNFPLNIYNDKSEKYNQFINDYKDYQKWLTRKKFNIWIQKYASFINGKFSQGITQGQRWFMIEKEGIENDNDLDNDFAF